MKKSDIELSLETQDLIERVPDRFNTWMVFFFLLLFLGLSCSAIFIKSPDIITAKIKISSIKPPIVIKSKSTGKLSLLVEQMPANCNPGQYVAVIENTADAFAIKDLKIFLESFNPLIDFDKPIYQTDLHLGDIASSYYSFANCIDEYRNIMAKYNQYVYELQSITNQMAMDSISLLYYKQLLETDSKRLAIVQDTYLTDSILFVDNVILESALKQSYSSLLEANNNLISEKNKVEELIMNYINGKHKEKNLRHQYALARQKASSALVSSYNALYADIRHWEDTYIFKSDVAATFEYANMISNNSFILTGEPVFTMIETENQHIGIAILPSTGAGTVKAGQKVNIKIDAYPFEEYGMLEGMVESISKNTVEEGYLAYVCLPSDLEGTLGEKFEFAEAMYGTAEIITQNKRLIEKIFYQIDKLLSRKNE